VAKMVLTAAYTNLNSNDLSSYCDKSELVVDVEDKETTTFGSSGWKEYLGGLKSGTLSLSFRQDVAASAIDSIVWPLLGTVVTFEVRNNSGTVTTSNPKWTGSVLINGWKPVNGSVGDVAEVDVSFPTTGAITRGTS
jgi:hypothetical protein